jgi:thiosulfate reductase cytochrome b subunit
MTENNKLYIYPLWLRIWHVINAFSCLTLIATGMSMQYSKQDNPIISFPIAVSWHNVAGILLLINYVAFIIGNAFSTNGNHYRVVFKGIISRLIIQFKFYTGGLFKNESEPYPITKTQKFNPIQQFTYIMVMYIFCPLIIITGCLMFFPEKVTMKIYLLNSYLIIDILHVFTGFVVSLFLIIHLYFSTISHDNKVISRFKSVITGYHEA